MKRLTILTIVAVFFLNSLDAQIINIPEDYPTIQEGIDASSNGDTVLVQQGMYPENIVFNGKSIVVTSMFLFTADTADLNQTIIDGQWWDEVVQIINNEDSTTALIGFSIINGVRGILISGANASIYSCKIHDNSFPTDAGGGGIAINGYIPGMDYNVVNIIGCEIYNNHCRHGGGIAIANNRGIVEGCKIYNNTNYENGNQVQFWNTETIMRNCYIEDSQVEGFDVIEFRGGCKPILENNIIVSNNSSGDEALFLSWEASSPILINNTIINSSGQQGEFITIYPPSHFTVYNSIAVGFHMNDGLGYKAEFCRFDNIPVDGQGNIMNDPLLNDDISLSDCSPCIGAGTISFVFNDSTYYSPNIDYLGNTRPQPDGSSSDMGAIENQYGFPLTPPSITTQPISTEICKGGSYTLEIEADGSPVLYYQWQKDNVDMEGETNTNLILNNLQQSDQGNYRCLVNNSCETISSNNALINVLAPPTITQQPEGKYAYVGNDISFEFEVSGDEPLSYQWYGPSGILLGDTLDYLLLTNINLSDSGYYYCTITNVCGMVTTDNVLLTIYNQLVVDAGNDLTMQSGSDTILNGSYQGGSPSIGYYWSPDSLLIDPYVLNPQTVNLFDTQIFTLTVTDSIVDYQGSDIMTVTVIESDTLNIANFGNDTIYEYEVARSICGFVSGNNCDNDLIKAQYFYDDLRLFEINEILIHFGKAVKTSEDDIQVKVGIWDNSGIDNTPGSLITSTFLPLSTIVENISSEQYSSIEFEEPVEVGNGFYIGVFLPQTEGDTVAVFTNKDGESGPNLGWTQKTDYEWSSYSQDPRWYLTISNAIFPIVKQINLSVDDIAAQENNYLIYPNPASNKVTVEVRKQGSDNSKVVLFDMQGKVLQQKKFTNNTNLDLQNLEKGIYLLSIFSNTEYEVHKIVIQ